MSHYWGPMFPDSAGNLYTKEAVAAELSLEDPQTVCSETQNVRYRAKIAGAGGNSIRVAMSDDALTSSGEISEVGNDVHIKYMNDVTNMGQLASLVAASTLIDMVGTWNVSDVIPAAEAEFAFTNLSGGVSALTGQRVTYWGPHFPDRPDTTLVVDPTGLEGVATFAMRLESGTKMTLSWATGVFKSYSGKERRMSTLSSPKESYTGQVLLVDDTLDVRTKLRKYASLSSVFLLGLPHEGVTISAISTGVTINVNSTANLDWMNPGQRVAVFSLGVNDESLNVEGVIQSFTSNTITIDGDVTDAGAIGAIVMPLVPVFIEPQQGFARFPAQGVERWQADFRAALFGFRSAALRATLPLEDPVTVGSETQLVILSAFSPGAAGNTIQVEFSGDALTSGGELEEDPLAMTVHVKFMTDVTTMGELDTLINTASSLIRMIGTWTPSEIVTGESEFGPLPLSGGVDETFVERGRGATIRTHEGTPIWDRFVRVENEATDSVQAMNDIVDLGGLPFNVGSATIPDWGRAVAIRKKLGSEFQWLIKFLSTVRGRQVSFLLPTGRNDLLAVGDALGEVGDSGSILIDSTFGDFFAWHPENCYIRVQQAAKVCHLLVEVGDLNGDGTITLQVIAHTGEGLPLAAPIEMISWMERCRFEQDDFDIFFETGTFALSTIARVVQQ